MNKIILINRLSPDIEFEDKKWIFFMIGGMGKLDVEERLVDTIDSMDFVSSEEVIFKYNGVTMNIKTKEIPKVSRVLMKNHFDIYSIYEIYNPEV